MISTLTIEPRYQETDQMGVIHHSVYPIWYEMGRIRFCQEIGFPFHEIEQRQVGLAMVDMSCHYVKPVYFGKRYTLETELAFFSRVKMGFSYQLKDDEGTLVHRGQTTLVWLSKSFYPMDIKKNHPDIYEAFIKHVRE